MVVSMILVANSFGRPLIMLAHKGAPVAKDKYVEAGTGGGTGEGTSTGVSTGTGGGKGTGVG